MRDAGNRDECIGLALFAARMPTSEPSLCPATMTREKRASALSCVDPTGRVVDVHVESQARLAALRRRGSRQWRACRTAARRRPPRPGPPPASCTCCPCRAARRIAVAVRGTGAGDDQHDWHLPSRGRRDQRPDKSCRSVWRAAPSAPRACSGAPRSRPTLATTDSRPARSGSK